MNFQKRRRQTKCVCVIILDHRYYTVYLCKQRKNSEIFARANEKAANVYSASSKYLRIRVKPQLFENYISTSMRQTSQDSPLPQNGLIPNQCRIPIPNMASINTSNMQKFPRADWVCFEHRSVSTASRFLSHFSPLPASAKMFKKRINSPMINLFFVRQQRTTQAEQQTGVFPNSSFITLSGMARKN